jgi:Uncharacterized protein conserved in bacteria (DUF2188)
MAAPNFAMEPCLFTVQQRDDTRWHVCETGLPRSLASFGLKQDAVEYARDLARAWLGEVDREAVDASEHCEHASTEEARSIGARAAASLAAGAIKKPAVTRA